MGRPKNIEAGRASARDNRVKQEDGFVSRFHINPEWLDTDNYHYAWVETHCMNQETQSVGEALRKQYTPVSQSEIPQLQTNSDILSKIRGRKSDDDFIKDGDQILMKCPLSAYEQRDRENRAINKRAEKHIDMHDPNFLGAPTFVQKERTSMSRTHEPVFAKD